MLHGRLPTLLVMTRIDSEADVEGRENREDVGLERAEDELEGEDHQTEEHGDGRDGHRAKNKDEREYADDDDVATSDVGEKTDEERERPREHRYDLDGDQDELHE